jgi:aspartate oxidase
MNTYNHDVLIIGSGLAGLIAACRLYDDGLTNIGIISAGLGGTPYIAAFNAVIKNSPYHDNTAWYCEDMLKAGYGLGDKKVVETLGNYTFNCIKLLEKWGVQFTHNDDGSYVLRHVSGHRCPRSLCRKDMLIGRHIADTLPFSLKEKGVAFYDNNSCVELLVANEKISGVSAINNKTKELSVFYAPNVIAAWGGIGNLFAESTYPPDIDGRGLAMAYNAGVNLIDLEFVEFEPMVCLSPEGARGEPCPTAMLGEGAYLLNNKGERFLLPIRPQGEAGAPKSFINKAILGEIKAGRGSPLGGAFVDLRHIDVNTLKSYPWFYERVTSAGVNPNKSLLEVGPMAHSYSGGMAIDTTCMSNIDGLYAAGEAAGGMHGACRMAGNAATQAAVSGYAAANSILADKRNGYEKIKPAEFLQDTSIQKIRIPIIRSLVTKYINRERNAGGLKEAIAELEKAAQVSEGDTLTSQLALSGLLLAKAALMREESRGTHYRADFPEQKADYSFSIKFSKDKDPEFIPRLD